MEHDTVERPTSVMEDTFSEISRLDVVEKVTVEGKNTITVKFNETTYWNIINQVMVTAIENWCIPAAYGKTGHDEYRYEFVDDGKIKKDYDEEAR